MNSPNNIQEKILQLANILSKFGAGEWVNTRKVAKLMEGSEVLSDVICAYAQLPEAKSYFAVLHNGSKILLTAAHRSLRRPAHDAQSRIVGDPECPSSQSRAF